MKKLFAHKPLAGVLATLLLVGGVAACNNETDPTESTGTDPANQTTMTTTSVEEDRSEATDPTQTETSGASTDTPATEDPGTTTEAPETEPPVISDEPYTMTAMLTTWGGIATEKPVHQAWLELMAEKMGRPIEVDIDYVPAAEYDEKANLAINGNAMPDYMITPFLYDYNNLGQQGMILDLAQYKEQMPNYFDKISQSHDGLMRITNDSGNVYGLWEVGLPRLPEDKGLVAANLTAYRTDILNAEGLEVPETQEEFLELARALKEKYPDIYPVNTQFQSFNALYFANHVTNDIFWDGTDYQYGPLTEGYRDAIRFARTLHEEGLLDPEYLTETNDTIREKALNDKNLMWLTMWFTTPGEISRSINWEKEFTVSLTPDNAKYGTAYENRSATNEVELSNWSVAVLNANTEDPDTLTQLVDLQFSDDVIRLITWGIEGETYEVDDEGNPNFIDAIRDADDPWVAGDEWGMRMSKSFRPGLQSAADTSAYINSAPDDSVYVDGEIKRVPVERAFPDIPYPDAPETPPWFNGPTLQFTTEESEELNTIMSAVNTMRDEYQAFLISGEESLDVLDNLETELSSVGDIERALDIYRAAKARYDAR